MDAGAGPGYILLFWGNITPLMVAAGGLGLVWAFAAAVGAYWPSAHLLAVIGAWGLFGGVSPADRYLVHPLAHAWVAYRIRRHKPNYHPWALVAVGVSAVVSAGASIAVASSAARCDGWSTVVACVVAVAVGVAVDASLRWWKYLALVESAAITLVVAANPLECVASPARGPLLRYLERFPRAVGGLTLKPTPNIITGHFASLSVSVR